MEVFDDATLREAYKVWLAAGHVGILFVLYIEVTDVPGAWITEKTLNERPNET